MVTPCNQLSSSDVAQVSPAAAMPRKYLHQPEGEHPSFAMDLFVQNKPDGFTGQHLAAPDALAIDKASTAVPASAAAAIIRT